MEYGSLFTRLRCPLHPDGGPLRRVEGDKELGAPPAGCDTGLRCTQCGHVYPVIDGIPDMVVSADFAGSFLEAECRQWDAHAQRYDNGRQQDPTYMAGVETTVDALAACPGDNILDAGCGTGLTVRHYLRPEVRVTALDLSMESLRYLRRVLGGAP